MEEVNLIIDREVAKEMRIPNFPICKVAIIQVPETVWVSYSGSAYYPKKSATASKPLSLEEAKKQGKAPSVLYKSFIRGLYKKYLLDEKYRKR